MEWGTRQWRAIEELVSSVRQDRELALLELLAVLRAGRERGLGVRFCDETNIVAELQAFRGDGTGEECVDEGGDVLHELLVSVGEQIPRSQIASALLLKRRSWGRVRGPDLLEFL